MASCCGGEWSTQANRQPQRGAERYDSSLYWIFDILRYYRIGQHPRPLGFYRLTPYLDDLLAFLARAIRPFFVLHRFLRGSRNGIEFLCSRCDMDGNALK